MRMKKGLFTVSYAGLWGQAKLDSVASIYKSAELGYDGVLFMGKSPHLFPNSTDSSMIAKLKNALKETQLEAIGVAAYNDFLLTTPVEVPLLEMQLNYIKESCRVTAELEAPLVRIFTGYHNPAMTTSASFQKMLEILHTCGEYAKEYGVTLAVQNHHDVAVSTKELHLLLSELNHPAVKAGYDAWSPYLRGEDLAEGAALMAEHTALTIVANYKLYEQFHYHSDLVNYSRLDPPMVRATTMSKGEIDFKTFLESLNKNGYDGWVVYEMCSPLIGGPSMENLDQHAKEFVTWMDESFS